MNDMNSRQNTVQTLYSDVKQLSSFIVKANLLSIQTMVPATSIRYESKHSLISFISASNTLSTSTETETSVIPMLGLKANSKYRLMSFP